jgi:hypothetical protein
MTLRIQVRFARIGDSAQRIGLALLHFGSIEAKIEFSSSGPTAVSLPESGQLST